MTHTVYVDGVALWSPLLPGWELARAAFQGDGMLADPPHKRPASDLLAPAERRRAPDTVALALEVAARAVECSGREASSLTSLFVSTHGDLGITDAICRTLADAPTSLSPIRFHNSVHNAAAGYWTIATGCRRASTALSAFDCSFGAGLLEAMTQCLADDAPVLLVAYDGIAVGPLASATHSEGLLAAALVLSPRQGPARIAALDWTLPSDATIHPDAVRSDAARAHGRNAMATCLPLFEALARRDERSLCIAASDRLALQVGLKDFL